MFSVPRGTGVCLCGCVAIAALAVGLVEGATINVPADYGTIQAAIDAASDNDEIVVAPTTYNERIDFKGRAIVVRSTAPTNPAVVAATIIDGGAGGSAVTFKSGEGSDSVLAGFTITNGSGTVDPWGEMAGGGIYCEGSSPTISGNTISGNWANYGGGISCYWSSPTISGNTISGNAADCGGGIECYENSSPTISRNTISGNSSTHDAGGICSWFDSSPTISGNTISGNWSDNIGGGIYCSRGSPTISGNTISGNSAGYGGGIGCASNSSPTIVNSIIAFSASGGGLYVGSGTCSLSYCDVYGNTGGDYLGIPDPTGTNGNISVDPLFAHAAGGDFHLQSAFGRWDPATSGWVTDGVHSPCIDAGDPASAYDTEPGPNGDRVNMGAYGNTPEASKSRRACPPTAPTLVEVSPTTPTTTDDLTALASGATDPEDDPLTYEYEWAKTTDGGASWSKWRDRQELDKAAAGGASSNVLDHRLTAKGEEWKARARASDGLLVSDWAESDPVTIQDTPPTAPTAVAIDPGCPQTDDDLTASASGATDPDGDPVTYEYEWSKRRNEGASWRPWGNPGDTLDHSLTARGQQWKARARAAAAGQTSGWTESAPVTVGNSPPTLAWLGQAPFRADGHDPQKGAPDATEFTFRVRVADPDDTAPRRMFVRLQRVQDGRRWVIITTVPLGAVSGTWAGGMTCEAKATLPNGAYRHRFYVQDRAGAVAAGEPAHWHPGPKIVAPPQLWTTNFPGRAFDFVHPNTGTAHSTRFKFSVLYTDGQGTLAYVHRLELQRKRPDGTWHNVPARNMRAWSGKPLTGKFYTWQGRLRAGEYRHRFVFEDNDGAATGADSPRADATQWRAGPVVSEATSAAVASAGGAVTSLAAVPSAGGLQIVFSLSAPMAVDARILNIAGRPVKTLCRGNECDAGPNTLLWNAQSDSGLPVPNGTYLIEVMAKAGDGAQARALAQLRLRR